MSILWDNLRVWRPSLPDSIDGKPLAVSISDLFSNFPYDRLPENNVVAFFMMPGNMLRLIVVYLVSEPIIKAAAKYLRISGKTKEFRTFVAIHNFALMVFSAVVMCNSWPVVLLNLKERGWESTYCDQDGTFWQSGLGAWSTIFYLSKYVEFIDTWILVLKGKKPSFLQVYHHAGIVFTMWGGVASQSAWMLVVVLLNSVIHTVMYAYFFVKTLHPEMQIRAAKYLTTAQICQFVIGITSTLGIQVMGERCDSAASRFILAVLQIYGVGLILLFSAFAARKYKKN